MNILIDTHILIRREYDRAIERHLQNVIRLINDLNFRIVVHPLSVEEVEKDKNILNKSILLSKIKTYSALETQSNPYDDSTFFELIGKPKNARDKVDSYLLYCLFKKEVDIFLTEDDDLTEKAAKLNISGRVKNLQESSTFFKKTLEAKKTRGGDVPTFCFYKEGGEWRIGKIGSTIIPYRDLKGFGYIHYMLDYEYKHLLPSVIYNQGKGSGEEEQVSGKEIADLGLRIQDDIFFNVKPSPKDVIKMKAAINLKIEKLKEAFRSISSSDPQERMLKEEALEEAIDKCSDLLAKLTSRKYDRDPHSQAEKARISVTKAIKKALLAIGKDKTTARYLNEHTIKTGDSCEYRPIEGDKPKWILFPEADNQ